MLDHCPCNCKTVKCTGTTSDLVQDQKTSGSGISQNIRNLCHFHHKGTLTACQIIRCTHTCKDSVNNSDICFFSRDKASDLCHQYDQAVCLIYVDLPAIFGPVIMDTLFLWLSRYVSFAINISFSIICSTTG